MERARLIIEVSAGVIPGTPMNEYAKRFVLTEQEWQNALGTQETADPIARGRVLAELNGRASGYAQYLMMQPDFVNWVRTDWLWL